MLLVESSVGVSGRVLEPDLVRAALADSDGGAAGPDARYARLRPRVLEGLGLPPGGGGAPRDGGGESGSAPKRARHAVD